MPTLKDIDPELMFVMMKGEPGLRKSTQALSFPGPQYWFSWDRKMSGILIPFKKWNLPADHITYDDYDDWSKASKKLESFQATCPYDTLVFDSLTSMADMTLRQTISKEKGGKTIANIRVNSIEDYSAESSALQELIALAKDIQSYHARQGNRKIKIVLIAHVVQAEYRNATTNTTHISRTIVTAGKKVAPKIPAYCTEVWHFNRKITGGFQGAASAEYSMLTQHSGDDYARTSLDLPNEIVFGDDPLYSKWIKPAIDRLKV